MNEEQIQILKSLVDELTKQGISKEDIQAQVDIKKQEFRSAKTSTTPKSPGVDAENFSGSELDDYFSDSPTEKNNAEPWLNEKPKEIIGDKDLSTKPLRMTDKFNPDGLNYEELKAKTDEEFVTKGRTPSGLLDELERLKSKEDSQKKGIKGYYQITDILNNIPEEVKQEAFADRYFNIEDRPISKKFESNRDIRFSQVVNKTEEESQQEIQEYLGQEKYQQYLDYKNKGTFEPYSEDNKIELNKLKTFSNHETKKNTAQLELRSFESEETQGWIQKLLDKNKPYKDDAQAKEGFEKEREAIFNSNVVNDFKIKEFEDGKGGEIKNQILESNSELQAISERAKNNNMQFASDEDRLKYKELIDKNTGLRDQYVSEGYADIFNSIVKTYENNQFLQNEYIDKVKDYNTASIFEGALALDYSETARAAQALEEFFVEGMLVGGSSLLAQTALEVGKGVLASGDVEGGKVKQNWDKAISVIKQKTTDYSLRLAEKRKKTIPDNIKIQDAIDGKVSYLDWLSESFANNSPSILTTFIPGALAFKGAAGVATARKIGGEVLAKALVKQADLGRLGMNAARNIFFFGESGGKFTELGLQEYNAKDEINTLNEQLKTEINPEKIKNIQARIDEIEPLTNYSFAQKAFTSYAFGGVATYAETVGSLKLIQGAGNLAAKIGVKEFKKQTYKTMPKFGFNLLKQTTGAIAPIFYKGMPIEIMEETFTQIGHNALDIVVLGEDKGLMEGVDLDFVLNTAVSVGAIMGPTTGSNVMNIFKNESRIRSEVLQNQGWVTDIISNQELMKTATGKELTELRKNQNKLLQNLALSDALSLQKLRFLDKDQLSQLDDVNRRIREVRKEATRLGSLSEDAGPKNKALERLQSQYDALSKTKEELLGAKQRKIKQDQIKIKENLKEKGITVKNLNLDYNIGLYELYSDVAMMGDAKRWKLYKT